MAAPRPQNPKPLEILPQTLNEVLVNVGKVLKSAGKDGKRNASVGPLVAQNKIPASIEVFNAALDDIEGEILRAKAVVQRDLNQIRASRRQEQRVAPPAPMALDISSPKMTKAQPPAPPTAQQLAFQNSAGQNSNQNRPVKQESKPVAPFPNMGFDLPASPEVTPVPVPSPKTLPKAKNSPRPSPRPSPAAKPAGGPVRKETKILPPQPPRSASGASPMLKKAIPAAARAQGVTPPLKQTPVPIPTVPTKQTPVPVPSIPPRQTPIPIPMPPAPSASAPAPAPPPPTVPAPAPAPAPLSAPASIPPAAGAPQAPMPPTTTGAENMFTAMAFSLAPPETLTGGGGANQPPEIDLVALGAGTFNMDGFQSANGGGPASMPNMDHFGGGGGLRQGAPPPPPPPHDDSNANDDRIDALFDLGSAGLDNIEMNYDLGDNNGDNSSFNDMYFNMNDDSTTTDQFDRAYFGLG
ncbi:hypothetical protein V8F06_003859 [Rhypophila decipiens]